MDDNQKLVARLEQFLSGKIGYHILRASLKRCASDLSEFVKEKEEFSNEQLYAAVSFCAHIRDQLEVLNKELGSRLEKHKK